MDTMKSLLTFPQKLLIKEYNAISETTFLNLLKSNSLLGLFFSAQWCPSCVQFTPILLDFYNKVNKDKKQIEIIFISHDEEEKEFDEYYKDMPWAAVPYDFDDREDISESFNIIGVPTFVVVNSKGKLVDAKGKVTILNDGIKAIDKWNEKK